MSHTYGYVPQTMYVRVSLDDGLTNLLTALVRRLDQTGLADAVAAEVMRRIQPLHAQEMSQMAALDDEIAREAAAVSANGSAISSAVQVLNSIQSRIDAAVAAASQAGATDQELQQMRDLSAALGGNTDTLAQAIAANTPAQPAP